MWWLLEDSVRKVMEQAQANGFTPSAEQQARFEARFSAFDDGGSTGNRILTIAGDKAEIAIEGILTKSPDLLSMLFGGGNTTFSEINSALAEASQNTNVKEAILAIDSPGGTVEGLFETLAALENFDKPLKAVISDKAASAAFGIASKADTIEAVNRSARIGSVGIVAEFRIDENRVAITNTDSPKKRPDVQTEAGKAIVREELDAMHDIFVEAIAIGRKTTVENVNTRFGQGATLLAETALERGMIDSIATTSLSLVGSNSNSTAAQGAQTLETAKMDIQTLKDDHPAVYALAVQDGIKQGVDSERDRVKAHLTMGEASGDMKTAIEAVGSGSDMSASMIATYQAASMNRKDNANRQDDENTAAAAAEGAVDDADQDMGDRVAAALEQQHGITAAA